MVGSFAGLVHLRAHDDDPDSARATADPDGGAAVLADLAALTTARAAQTPRSRHDASPPPTTHVVIVDGAGTWRSDPNLRTIMGTGSDHRVHVIALADVAEHLPHEARAVVALHDDDLRLLRADEPIALGVVDGTGEAWARRLTTALAPLRDATPGSTGGSLPTAARWVDVVGCDPDDLDGFAEEWRHDEGTPPISRSSSASVATARCASTCAGTARTPSSQARPAPASRSSCRPGSPPWRRTCRPRRSPSCSSTTRVARPSPSAPGSRTPSACSPTSTRPPPSAP
ncbi:hypothetical protein ON003_04755 [Janibacter hoylei]|nr:hypothetical protein [Janibacter hoylei]MCW4600987.1 hypothetical protein [Janibacter hoylei]